MPKLPPISGADLVRVLERSGWERVGQTGSHVKLRRGARRCVVPLHRELKKGTLAGILSQADMSRDDFLRSTLH